MPLSPIFGDQDVIPGCWRAQIAVVEDGQERARYRVRVFQLHDENIPADRLPFAEYGGAFAYKGGGDVPPWEVGDLVWVMFEGGQLEYPVILGGWISQSQGVPDLLPEQQENYVQNRKRWIRKDRAGNLLELSAVPGEDRVRIKSGRAEIVVTRLDNGVQITAKDGPVTIIADRATVKAQELQLEGGNTSVLANGQTPPADPTEAVPTPGVPSGVHHVFSNKTLRAYAGAIPGTDPLGLVEIGQYVDAALAPRQSGVVRLQPQLLQLGVALPPDGTIPTLFVDAACVTRMRLLAPSVVIGQEGLDDFLVKFTQFKLEFDTHVHTLVTPGGGSSGPPPLPGLTPLSSTVNTRAS
jgi:hypothetical protein